jgi:hypothetical protein
MAKKIEFTLFTEVAAENKFDLGNINHTEDAFFGCLQIIFKQENLQMFHFVSKFNIFFVKIVIHLM